jgi:hypothetical protein
MVGLLRVPLWNDQAAAIVEAGGQAAVAFSF